MHDDSQRSKSITTNIFVATRAICDHGIQCRFNTSCKGHLDDILEEQKYLVGRANVFCKALYPVDRIMVNNIANRFLQWFWYTLGCIGPRLVIAEYIINIAASFLPFPDSSIPSGNSLHSSERRLPPNLKLNLNFPIIIILHKNGIKNQGHQMSKAPRRRCRARNKRQRAGPSPRCSTTGRRSALAGARWCRWAARPQRRRRDQRKPRSNRWGRWCLVDSVDCYVVVSTSSQPFEK